MRTRFEAFSLRRALRLLMPLWFALAAQSVVFAQDEKLYYFVDEHGVPHISNTPTDPRYKPYIPGKRGEQPGTSSNVESPVAPQEMDLPEVDAPDENPEPPEVEPPIAEPPPVQHPPPPGAR